MSELAVKELGYDNNEHPADPYKWVHAFAPSLYETNKGSGKWYFYFEGREIYVTLDELKQLIKIFSQQ